MSLRDAGDAFRLLQCTVDISAVDGLSTAGTDWLNLSRVSDDVTLFLKNRSEHTADLRAEFDRICFANLKLKPSKCSLFADQVR